MRINLLQKRLRSENISCAIFSGFSEDVNLSYILGFCTENTLLFVPKKGNSILLAPKMDVPGIIKKTTAKVLPFEKNVAGQIKKIAGKYKTIGINKNKLTIKEFEWLKKGLNQKKFEDVSLIMSEIRSIKEKDELRKLKKSCSIADSLIQEAIDYAKTAKNESEVKSLLLKMAAENGCSPAFDALVASAKNTSYVHYSDCNKKIKKGFFYIDFGVDYKGYKSDITRTTYIGKPTTKEKEIYNELLKIQISAIKMAKRGVYCHEIEGAVREKLGKLNEYFTHSLGHGVGLEVHEAPTISKNSDACLKEGNVITIEPGVYFPGKFGIRIEDTIEITKNGAKELTKAKKEFM